jgi:hypothetical protein
MRCTSFLVRQHHLFCENMREEIDSWRLLCTVHGLVNGEGVNMAAAQNVELFGVPVSVFPANYIYAFQDTLYGR